MPKLRNLSGEDVVTILSQFGFQVVSKRGSHVKLRRVVVGGVKQTLTIPQHKELDKGTARAILKQASRYVTEEQLRPHFYAD